MKAAKPISALERNLNKESSENKIEKTTYEWVEMDCECGGIIEGEAWCNENYEVLKFDHLECRKCNWAQLS